MLFFLFILLIAESACEAETLIAVVNITLVFKPPSGVYDKELKRRKMATDR